jgi:Family of unknown function (DUF6418)
LLTIVPAVAVFIMLCWMLRCRTAAAIAAAFILFSLVTRTLSLVFVDLARPVYADELEAMVGGGPSMPLFACSVLVFMAGVSYVFRPSRIQQVPLPALRSSARRGGFGTASLFMVSGFTIALYGDMLMRGPVPLFAGIDRIEYGQMMAGPLHPVVFEYGFLLAGLLGINFVRSRLLGGDFDFAFLWLFLCLLAYFALTGHRFSAFYSFTSFFALPVAALLVLRSRGVLPPHPRRGRLVEMALSRTGRVIMLSLLGSAVAGLVLNSVINVREYDDPLRLIMQRTMVQPVELWWMTWKDIGVGSHPGPAAMWNSLFVNPIDPARNTSIQALMLINVGDDRTRELLAMGQQYAGGYPEVLFELFGPYLALPVAAAFGLVTALLLRLVVTATCQGRAFTALLALYVYFGFSLLYIGGMLNFLLAWTFWLKLLALAVACAIERPYGARASGAGRSRTLRPVASSASSQTP